jgi:hypothetical protein
VRSYKKVGVLTFATFVVAGIIALTAINNPSQLSQGQTNHTLPRRESTEESQYPIVGYESPEPTNPDELRIRRIRGARYDGGGRPLAEIQQLPPVILELPVIHAPAEPALPADQSDAVVIGTITGAQAYLSNNRSNVYSEFTVQIEEVLKGNSASTLGVGSTITTARAGGRVRLPNGFIHRQGFLGKGMPLRGRRYLLFLRHNDQGQDFSIITGYELRGGRVFPLDGLLRSNYEVYRNYNTYRGVEEIEFLSTLRESIILSSSEGRTN